MKSPVKRLFVANSQVNDNQKLPISKDSPMPQLCATILNIYIFSWQIGPFFLIFATIYINLCNMTLGKKYVDLFEWYQMAVAIKSWMIILKWIVRFTKIKTLIAITTVVRVKGNVGRTITDYSFMSLKNFIVFLRKLRFSSYQMLLSAALYYCLFISQ